MKFFKHVVFLLLVSHTPAVFACLHADGGPGFTQTGFEVVLAHANGVQTTIIQPKFEVDKSKSLGWVFPVPKLPAKIDVADKNTFKLLNEHFLVPAPTKGKARAKNLTVHETYDVGPFSITPIEGGYDGVAAWMKKNKFSPVEKSHLKPYLDKGYVVLATKVKVEFLENSEKKVGELPPIFLQFESEHIEFPLMFERTKFNFVPFKFFIFTQKKLPKEALLKLKLERAKDIKNLDRLHEIFRVVSEERRLKSPGGSVKNLPKEIQPLLKKIGFEASETVHVEVFELFANSHAEAEKAKIPDLTISLNGKLQPQAKAEIPDLDLKPYNVSDDKKPDPTREYDVAPKETDPIMCAMKTSPPPPPLALLLFVALIFYRRREA